MDDVIDLRLVPAEQWVAVVIERFDRLAHGDGFVFVSDQLHPEVLESLHVQFAGLFEWVPLEQGEICRVTIFRRPKGTLCHRYVLEFMIKEHTRLQWLAECLIEDAKNASWEAAVDCLLLLTRCSSPRRGSS